MPKPYATIFIHGLAKKPAPDKLREIWLWGITRDNPNPAFFAPPNRGINSSQGIPSFFNYYADVFYGTEYEMELESYYEADDELAILDGEHLNQIEPGLKLPQAVPPRERAFLRNFEGKLGASPVLTTPPAAIATTGRGRTTIRWCIGSGNRKLAADGHQASGHQEGRNGGVLLPF
jgi:hypothetical protein